MAQSHAVHYDKDPGFAFALEKGAGPSQCCGGISADPMKSAGRISIFMTFKIVLPRL